MIAFKFMVDSFPQVSNTLFAFLLLMLKKKTEEEKKRILTFNKKSLINTWGLPSYFFKMNISTFLNWSKERGIVSSASVKETIYAGYGLFSTRLISDTLPIVSIPQDMLLTWRKALKVDSTFSQGIFNLLSKDIESVAQTAENERLVLCLFLIYCKFFNLETSWNHYIDILPTIDFFKENHILFNPECVSGTSLENSVRTKISNLKRELDEITQQDWLSNIQFDMYMWADCIFWSRVVGIGGDEHNKSLAEMALIPFFDFANHSMDKPNIRWQLNNRGIDLITYPNEIIANDQELLLSYGSKPNQELLFLHGFCIENNPEPSRITIPLLPFLNPTEESYNLQKIHWLKQLGMKPSLTLVYQDNNDDLISGGWTFDSIATMYLVALDEDNEIDFSVNDNDDIDLILSGEKIESFEALEANIKKMIMFPVIKLRVVVLLQDALEYHYTLITTPKSDDSSLWRQASIYRTEEATALKATIDNLSNIRDRLMQDATVLSYLE